MDTATVVYSVVVPLDFNIDKEKLQTDLDYVDHIKDKIIDLADTLIMDGQNICIHDSTISELID